MGDAEMRSFLAALVAIVVISVAANAALTMGLDFSAENTYRMSDVRLDPHE